MITTIAAAIVAGTLIGGFAGLLIPGQHKASIIVTPLLAALGAFLGSWMTYVFAYPDNGFRVIPFVIGVLEAGLLTGSSVMVFCRGRTSTR